MRKRAPRASEAESEVVVRRVERGSAYVRVSSVGTEGKRPFLLVPGIGVSSNYFERLAAELNDFGPVHALDLPGFGGVPHPKDRKMTIGDYADLVGAVIDDLELDDPVLIGHSMGTQVVADLAARYPEGFAGSAPLSSVVLLGPVINKNERRLRTTIWRFLRVARREPPRVALLAVYAYVLCGLPWFFRVLPQMMRYRIEEVIPEITSNVLVVAGEFDDLCPGFWADEVTELAPNARSFTISNAAHSVMHAHAYEVAALCMAHVRRPGSEPLELPDDVGQHQSSHDGADHEAADSEGTQVMAGQVTELIGILSDDDAKIAEGRTKQAQAMEEEQEQRRSSGGPDPASEVDRQS